MPTRARPQILVLFAALAVCLLVASPGLAKGRVALIIGNAAYSNEIRLNNPVNDADDLATAFEGLNFDVDLHHDLTFAGMRRALREFSRKAAGADIAVIYFAGHGMEVGGRNYLIPTDAELATDRDLPYEAFEIAQLTQAIADVEGLKLLILDACRDNPFAQTMEMTSQKRSVGRGFSRVEPASGNMLIAYSAAAGTTADDGSGRNSPYARALLKHIGEPGLDIRFMFGKVREDVLQSTGTQKPAEYSSLPGRPIFLIEPEPGVPAAVDETPEESVSADTVVAAWAIVEQTDDISLLEAFREQFGEKNAFYDALARRRIESLSKSEEAMAKPEPEPTEPERKRRTTLAEYGLMVTPDEKGYGVRVIGVQPGSAADDAEITAGSRIVSVDREDVASAADIEESLGAVAASGRRAVALLVEHHDRYSYAVLKTEDGEDTESTPPEIALAGYGLTVLPFGDGRGVLVTAVASGSAAANAGIRSGVEMFQVNEKTVASADDIFKAIESAKSYGRSSIPVTLSYPSGPLWFRYLLID
ncbi:caspase family protein [Oricola sp.]|uniref:caspase family protein n=1 Tax=Oricola sp. TaxID=1979950 RepID=UPI0025FA58F7|nr:caspase family protein [Oricola sp.]MCI5077991.1 caspase family protein [Oricola sp.]